MTVAVQDKRGNSNPVIHWNRIGNEIFPSMLARSSIRAHGHPPRCDSRCRQRHRAPLRTLHCSPLVPWSVTRCCRRQRSSRGDARLDSQSAATNQQEYTAVLADVRDGPAETRSAARSRGGPRQPRPTSRRWHRSESVASATGPNHRAGLCVHGEARRLRLHSALRRPAAWARGALSRAGADSRRSSSTSHVIVSKARIHCAAGAMRPTSTSSRPTADVDGSARTPNQTNTAFFIFASHSRSGTTSPLL